MKQLACIIGILALTFAFCLDCRPREGEIVDKVATQLSDGRITYIVVRQSNGELVPVMVSEDAWGDYKVGETVVVWNMVIGEQ